MWNVRTFLTQLDAKYALHGAWFESSGKSLQHTLFFHSNVPVTDNIQVNYLNKLIATGLIKTHSKCMKICRHQNRFSYSEIVWDEV